MARSKSMKFGVEGKVGRAPRATASDTENRQKGNSAVGADVAGKRGNRGKNPDSSGQPGRQDAVVREEKRQKRRRSASSVLTKPADAGPTAGIVQKRIDLSSVEVWQINTTSGLPAFEFRVDGKGFVFRAKDIVESKLPLYARLADCRVVLLDPVSKATVTNLMLGAPLREDRIGVELPGPIAGGAAWAYGNGEILGPEKTKYIPVFSPEASFAKRGNFKTYIAMVSNIVAGQAIPTFLFFFALAPILQGAAAKAELYVENQIIDLCGETSKYKSTLACHLMGSVWGGSDRKTGFGYSWNGTPAGIEDLCPAYSGSLLIIDDVSAAGATASARGELVQGVIHRVSSGAPKLRHNEEKGAVFKLLAVSTSNEPLETLIQSARSFEDATRVRLLSLYCPDRPLGYFDKIPEGYGDLETATSALRKICSENYGHLARRLISKVTRWNTEKDGALSDFVGKYMRKFIAAVQGKNGPLAPDEMRRVKVFALAYATAMVAMKTGALSFADFKNPGTLILAAYRLQADRSRRLAHHPAIDAFLRDNTKKISVLGTEKPRLSDKAFSRIDGFIKEQPQKPLVLYVPTNKIDALGLTRGELQAMLKRGDLEANEGLRSKKMLRLNEGGKEVAERFYAFPILQVPDHLKVGR